MEKDIFEFDENRIKEKIKNEFGLIKKIKTSFNYLEGKLHQNKITKTLKNLKTYEGKNYDFYMFKDKDVSILVRQYQRHFTIFTYNRPKDSNKYFGQRFSIFTMYDNHEKMTDQDYTDDYLQTFRNALPQIVKLVREDEIDAVWNSVCFEVPKYTEVKCVFTREVIDNIDLLIFACSEITQKHLEIFAENEMLDRVKTLNVGDPFGEVYEVVETRTEVENNYYHGVGITIKRIDDFGKGDEPKWEDVYSLCRWYYKEMFPDIELKEKVLKFYDDNWRVVYYPLTKLFFFDEIDFFEKFMIGFNDIIKSMNHFMSKEKCPFKCSDNEFRRIISKNYSDKVKFLYNDLVNRK